VPLKRVIKFDALKTFPQYITLDEWSKVVGIGNSTAGEMLRSFSTNVIYLEFFPIPKKQFLSCKPKFMEGICMRMVKKKHGGSSLQVQFHPQGIYFVNIFNSMFTYVVNSYWAKV
jgi:hypothetical protein